MIYSRLGCSYQRPYICLDYCKLKRTELFFQTDEILADYYNKNNLLRLSQKDLLPAGRSRLTKEWEKVMVESLACLRNMQDVKL